VWSSIPENDSSVLDAVRKHQFPNSTLVILRGQFDYGDLWRWREEISSEASTLLSGIAVDQSRNRILVGVNNDLDRVSVIELATAQQIPAEALIFARISSDHWE
jgi:hypothetical protein